jgi:hypothetical protein
VTRASGPPVCRLLHLSVRLSPRASPRTPVVGIPQGYACAPTIRNSHPSGELGHYRSVPIFGVLSHSCMVGLTLRITAILGLAIFTMTAVCVTRAVLRHPRAGQPHHGIIWPSARLPNVQGRTLLEFVHNLPPSMRHRLPTIEQRLAAGTVLTGPDVPGSGFESQTSRVRAQAKTFERYE